MLRAESTTYSATHYTPNDENPALVSERQGEELVIVSGYQSRSNHRASISGSSSICSDEMMLMTMQSDNLDSSSNFRFCKELLNWVFQESGVLRASNLIHNKKGERCD